MKIFLVQVMALLAGTLAAQTTMELPLYPDGAPDSNGLEGKERWDESRGILHNASTAKVFVYLPAAAGVSAPVKAVVICPGGGYGILAMKHEGHDVVQWLAARGIAGIVLQYRMPNGHHAIPLADLHEAIRTVRSNAAQWNINPAKVGVMGFSAGGHLASTAAVHYDTATRPDFAILIYPVIEFFGRAAHSGSQKKLLGEVPAESAGAAAQAEYEALARKYFARLHVTAQTPPIFFAHSDDDKVVSPTNSTMMYDALKAAGVPAELHIWPSGGHGWGFRENFPYRAEFLTALGRWLEER